MSKASKKPTRESRLKRVQAALGRLGEDIPGEVAPEKKVALEQDLMEVAEDLFVPLWRNLEKGSSPKAMMTHLRWLERVETSLQGADAPPQAGWALRASLDHMMMTYGAPVRSEALGDNERWVPVSLQVLVSLPPGGAHSLVGLRLDPTSTREVLSHRLGLSMDQVWMGEHVGEGGSESTIASEWWLAVPSVMALVALVADEDVNSARRMHNTEVLGLHHQMVEEMSKGFQALLVDGEKEEGEAAPLGGEVFQPGGECVTLYAWLPAPDGPVDSARFKDWSDKISAGGALPLKYEDERDGYEVSAHLLAIGPTMSVADRMIAPDTLVGFNVFLHETRQRLGDAWGGVKAYMYPTISEDDEYIGSGRTSGVRVVIWSTELDQRVEGFEGLDYIPHEKVPLVMAKLAEVMNQEDLVFEAIEAQVAGYDESTEEPTWWSPNEPSKDQGRQPAARIKLGGATF